MNHTNEWWTLKIFTIFIMTHSMKIVEFQLLFLYESDVLSDIKGQLNSEWIHEDIDFPKWQQKCCKDFCTESFNSFLGASWNHFGASCRLLYSLCYSISPQKAQNSFQEAPRKLQKFQVRNSYIIFVAILEIRCLHKFILSLTEL